VADVIKVVEDLDLVVELSEGHLHPDDVAGLRRSAAAVREQAGHLGTTLVLALVGGTGAGKSSLLNALAGEEIASVSAVRPHTDQPLAWIPAEPEGSLVHLLDRLRITERVPQDRFPAIAVLDLADVDSVEEGHRRRVEALLPDIDVVVWVLDPVKYADPRLHRDLIAPLADSARRFVFVLNRSDTVSPPALAEVKDDLHRRLYEDGVIAPDIFVVAANPPSGEPQGIAALAAHLEERLDEKRIHLGKLIADARAAARRAAGAAGVAGGGSLDFENRWKRLRDSAADTLARGGPTLGSVEETLCAIEDLVGHLSVESGGSFGTRIRKTFTPERIERELQEAVEAMEAVVERPRDRDGRPDPLGSEDADRAARVLDDELQNRIGAPLRKLLWERASLSSVVASLAVDATEAEQNAFAAFGPGS
jgi:hypothetical protein